MNENRNKIKVTVCGVRIENIEEPLMREIRYLDKLIDELDQRKTHGQNPADINSPQKQNTTSFSYSTSEGASLFFRGFFVFLEKNVLSPR